MDAPRAILRVKWGKDSGRAAVLRPGESVKVGRGDRAGLVIAGDPEMSAVHFEVAWDGARLSFRDLRSATGTLRNGEPGLTSGDLAHGDWLKAGGTVFTLHVEAHTPPRPADEEDLSEDDPALSARRAERSAERDLLEQARTAALATLSALAAEEPLYAALDAARDRRILEVLRESVEDHASLYDGLQGEALAHVAPYLVRLPAGSRLLPTLVREGWGRRWGIYLTSKLPVREVRRHLRRFLMVESGESGERMYFRYYDPGVMATFLAIATTQQRSDLFAGLLHLVTEGEGRACEVHTANGRRT